MVQRVLHEDLLVVRAGGESDEEPDQVDLGSLGDETWISTREGSPGAAVLRHLCRDRGFEPAVSYRSDNYAVIQGLVRTGLGIAMVPALGHRPGPGLSASRIGHAAAYREVLAASSPTAPVALVEAFVGSLTRAAQVSCTDRESVAAT
jgi:DNA-binding transcriptional LysR family regulator